MNSGVARALRRYAVPVVPDIAKKQFPVMTDKVYKFLKRAWRGLSHREKGRLRRIAEAGRPLPERIKQLARDRGLVVEWPVRPKATRPKGTKPKGLRDWGKPGSWRHRQYGPRIR